MPNLVAISQSTTEINRGEDSAAPQAVSVSNRPGQIGLMENHIQCIMRPFALKQHFVLASDGF